MDKAFRNPDFLPERRENQKSVQSHFRLQTFGLQSFDFRLLEIRGLLSVHMKCPALLLTALVCAADLQPNPARAAANKASVLVEAESFSSTGGWMVDPQF